MVKQCDIIGIDKHYGATIHVNPKVKEALTDVKEEYLRHNPTMRGVKISEGKLMVEIIDFYLRDARGWLQ